MVLELYINGIVQCVLQPLAPFSQCVFIHAVVYIGSLFLLLL